MFKMLIIAAAFVGGLLYFGVLGDVGEIVTEMLPEAAQRYSPSDAESDSRSPLQSLLSLSSFGQKRGRHITKVRLPLFMTGWGPGERDEKAPTQVNSDAIWTSVPA